MYKFQQEVKEGISAKQLKNSSFLWVWNPSEISPHLGISINGLYYSLKADDIQKNVQVELLLELIERKRRSVLFIEFNNQLDVNQVARTFDGYSSCEANNCSCSAPLFELVKSNKTHGVLFDLLEELDVINCYSKGLALPFEGIPYYSYADVERNLRNILIV